MRVQPAQRERMDEVDHLRDDIRELRSMIDSALARGANQRTLDAYREVLRERRKRLAELETTVQSRRDKVD